MAIVFEDSQPRKGRIVFDENPDADLEENFRRYGRPTEDITPYTETILMAREDANRRNALEARRIAGETDAEFVARTTPQLVNAPRQSTLSRLTGGALTTWGDEGFTPASTGFAPEQAYRTVAPILEDPEMIASGVRLIGVGGGGALGFLSGGPPGAYLGGIAGGAAVEPYAQSITPREESLAETSINLASNALPPLSRIGRGLLPQIASEAAYGAGIANAQLAGQSLLERGELPSAEEVRNVTLLGAGIGGTSGLAMNRGATTPQVPKSTQILQDATKPKPLANIASEAAAKTQGNPYAVQQSINEMLNIPPQTPMVPSTAREAAEALEPLLARRDSATEAFTKQAELETQFNLARAEEALQEAQAARLAQPESVELTSSPANQRLQMLDTVEGNAARERARLTEIVEAENPALPQIDEPTLSPQAQRMYDEYGRVDPSLLAPVAGAGAGGVAGGVMTERQEGESEEEYRARRLRNSIIGGLGGLAAGSTARTVANKVLRSPVRQTKSHILKEVDTILTPKKETTSLIERVGDIKDGFRYLFNTRYAPIGAAQRSLYKESGRTFTPNAYYDLERDFERVAGAPVKAEGEVKILDDIVREIPSENAGDFDRFLVLSRIEDRLLNDTDGRKRVASWTATKARQGLDELKAEVGPQVYAQLEKAGQDFQNLMRRTLQIQVDSGRLSKEVMDGVLDSSDFYAPFKVLKYFEDEEAFVKGGGKRITSSEQLVKKMTGIDDEDFRIELPTNVAAEQVYKGYILAEKNMKMRRLATLSRLDPDGDYVKIIPEDAKPRKGYEKVSYFQNGDKKYLEVSEDIAKALSGMDGQETGVILNGLGMASSVFKMGATGASIPFNISNALVFDPIRLGVISKYGFRNPIDMAWTLVEWPKALAASVSGNLLNRPNALYEEWIRSGAANSTIARVLTPEVFASKNPTRVGFGEALVESNFGAGKAIKAASLLSNTIEETTKLWGLQRAKRIERLDKLSPKELERKWPEIVTEIRNYAGSPDFARSGVAMKPLNIILPFLNARWQGASQDMARLNPFLQGNAKDAGAAWARMGSLIAMPSAALAIYNLQPDNEADFMQIPEDERKRYHHIPLYADDKGEPTILGTGTPYRFNNKDGVSIRGYYRIPKREFPGLLSNTIEDFILYAKGTSPDGFADIASNFADNFLDTASPVSISGDTVEERLSSAAAGLNPAIRLPLETAANRSFFTGRNIVPESRVNASPEKRYTEQTPEVYKDIANALPDTLPEVLRSPANLQHLSEGLTGGFVRQFAPPQLSEGNPALNANQTLGRFFRSERVDNAELMEGAKAAERARTDQRIDEQEIASALAEAIMSKQTIQERQKIIADAVSTGLLTPEIEKKLTEELKDVQRGLTYEDRVIKRSYTVSGGFRARYYADRLASMPREQWGAYIQEQARKGLLTDDVAKQLGELLTQPQRR